MQTIRCKMTCHAIEPNPYSDEANPLSMVRLGAVWAPEKDPSEDATYGKYTPFGELKVQIRAELAEAMTVGQAYYVDIQIP